MKHNTGFSSVLAVISSSLAQRGEEGKKATGDATVISVTADLLLVHSCTLTHTQKQACVCARVSLSVHLCDAFFSSVFIFFPCIYFGASWPVSPVGANSAKVTGSSPMYICLGLGWRLKKVTLFPS